MAVDIVIEVFRLQKFRLEVIIPGVYIILSPILLRDSKLTMQAVMHSSRLRGTHSGRHPVLKRKRLPLSPSFVKKLV